MTGGCVAEKVASREKRWHECGLEEKVERLRMVLRATNERASFAQCTAVDALEIARRHEHGVNGNALMPAADAASNQILGLKASYDGAYIARMLD